MPASRVTFLVPLDGVRFSQNLGRGDRVSGGLWISNDTQYLKDRILTDVMSHAVGAIDIGKFNGGDAYIYAQYDSKLTPESAQLHDTLGAHLYQSQRLILGLWLIRDNGANMERGFLEVSDSQRSCVISDALWVRFIPADGNARTTTTFTRDELRHVRQIFDTADVSPVDESDVANDSVPGQPYGKSVPLVKLALYYLTIARTAHFLPIRVAQYCTCLEVLFLRETQELSHRMAERVAWFLGRDPHDRMDVFKTVKLAYGLRSRTVHGMRIKETAEALQKLVLDMDGLVRRIFERIFSERRIRDIFSTTSDQVFNEFMEKMVFGVDMNLAEELLSSDGAGGT